MRRQAAMAVLGLALAGCAQDSSLEPSYLGMGPAEAEDAPKSDGVDPALRGISSNKVLGAMAFQKATGRSVDPSRLGGGK